MGESKRGTVQLNDDSIPDPQGDAVETDHVDAGPDNNSSSVLFSGKNTRIYISRELALKVVALGIPKETGAVGRFVTAVADQAISSGAGWVPSLAEATAINLAIHSRLAELETVSVHLTRVLAELEAAAEFDQLASSLRDQNPQEGTK